MEQSINPQNTNAIIQDKVKKFIEKIKDKKQIELSDFNLYNKIKKENTISPLMVFILEKAIEKYNNNEIENQIEKVGFGEFPGITNKMEENNILFFESKNAFVLYVSFDEALIGNFWCNHQLLCDLLAINPIKEVLNSNLKLCSTFSNSSKSSKNEINFINDSNKKENLENENNNKYYKLSLGGNFEYNSLKFLLYGIKEYINFPRIIFYPIVNFKDYEEIDSVIYVKEIKDDLKEYYKNFKSIDLDYSKPRKDFKLNKNDILFIEVAFEIEIKKKKFYDFFLKIISFLTLYKNKGFLNEFKNYKIKPIILYNNNYNIKKEIITSIIDSINSLKMCIKKLKIKKFEEIYENLQIIYCWPTMPLMNNMITNNDLTKKIEENKKEINILNKEINDLNEKIVILEKTINYKNNNNNFKKFLHYNRNKNNYKKNYYYPYYKKKRNYIYNNKYYYYYDYY